MARIVDEVDGAAFRAHEDVHRDVSLQSGVEEFLVAFSQEQVGQEARSAAQLARAKRVRAVVLHGNLASDAGVVVMVLAVLAEAFRCAAEHIKKAHDLLPSGARWNPASISIFAT